jgi:hypothetical protein
MDAGHGADHEHPPGGRPARDAEERGRIARLVGARERLLALVEGEVGEVLVSISRSPAPLSPSRRAPRLRLPGARITIRAAPVATRCGVPIRYPATAAARAAAAPLGVRLAVTLPSGSIASSTTASPSG